MRIAIVTETWRPSLNGVVTRLTATIGRLTAAGHQVLLVAPHAAEDVFEGARVRSVPALGLPFIYGGQPWGLPLPRVLRMLDDFRPDVTHAVSPFVLGWAAVLHARTRGVPLVCSYHTHVARYAQFYGMPFAERPAWAIVRRLHRWADLNLAASEAARREIEAEGVREVAVWPGGVDLSRFGPRQRSAGARARLGGRDGQRLALYVGRLALEKGIERLLPLARTPGYRLALVGEGPARAGLESVFAGTGATFAGPLHGDDLAAAYASADLFAFPSTTDTLGLVVLEALASGLPVVAADSAASRELAGSLPATRLFNPGDPGSLLSAAGRAAAEPARDLIAWAARRQVTGWDHSVGLLVRGYETARAAAAGRAAA